MGFKYSFYASICNFCTLPFPTNPSHYLCNSKTFQCLNTFYKSMQESHDSDPTSSDKYKTFSDKGKKKKTNKLLVVHCRFSLKMQNKIQQYDKVENMEIFVYIKIKEKKRKCHKILQIS